VFVRGDTGDRLLLFRDMLSIYKKFLSEEFANLGNTDTEIVVRDSFKKNPQRAPLVIIERGQLSHVPKSLMMNEQKIFDVNTNSNIYNTMHVIDYPIQFTCVGNSYLETEKISNIVVETLLTSAMGALKTEHPNISGADLVLWGQTEKLEGEGSVLSSCQILGKITLIIQGIYSKPN